MRYRVLHFWKEEELASQQQEAGGVEGGAPGGKSDEEDEEDEEDGQDESDDQDFRSR